MYLRYLREKIEEDYDLNAFQGMIEGPRDETWK